MIITYLGADATCSDSKTRDLKATYIRWGDKKCGENANLIYSGKRDMQVKTFHFSEKVKTFWHRANRL